MAQPRHHENPGVVLHNVNASNLKAHSMWLKLLALLSMVQPCMFHKQHLSWHFNAAFEVCMT
jgi:hypothetical protein